MEKMKWVDVGFNAASKAFEQDLDTVLTRAAHANVSVLGTGTSVAGLSHLSLAARNKENMLGYTAGIHPHAAERDGLNLNTLKRYWEDPKCVAIGETGLDYFRMISPKVKQMEIFEAQVEASQKHNKPLFLHCRDAFNDMYEVLRKNQCRGIVHCFTGNAEQARSWLDLGLDIGFTGWTTKVDVYDVKEVLRYTPLDRVHLETDAPYLFPACVDRQLPWRKYNGFWRSEPAMLPLLAQWLHEHIVRTPDIETWTNKIFQNAVRLFGLNEARLTIERSNFEPV